MDANALVAQQADDLVLAGHYGEARELCERLLAEQPDHLPALCILGNAALMQQDYATAYESFMIVASLDPDVVDAHTGLGLAAQGLGRYEEALMHVRSAADLAPDSAALRKLLGNLLLLLGRAAEAQSYLRPTSAPHTPGPHSARPVAPNRPHGHNRPNVRKRATATAKERERPDWESLLREGKDLLSRGRSTEAIARLRDVIRLRPDIPDSYVELSVALMQTEQPEEAERYCREGLAQSPYAAHLHNNLGTTLVMQRRFEEAQEAFRQAWVCDPDMVPIYGNWGSTLLSLGLPAEAEATYREGIARDPHMVALRTGLGSALLMQGHTRDAMEALEAIPMADLTDIAARAEVAALLGVTYLIRGDYRRGWQGVEWRSSHRLRHLEKPRWQGEPLQGRRILVWCEQGMGDTIQFARYLPQVKARGGRVILEHPPELASLLQHVPDVDTLIPQREDGGAPPNPPDVSYDVQISLMSLPGLFRTDLDTIPAPIPYLSADPARVRAWRERLAANGPGYRVGLVWAGGRAYLNDVFRSTRLAEFIPLAGIPGLQFYSLQKGEAATEAAMPPEGIDWTDLAPELHDFADTAAAILNLDLILTVDTAVAHLAGALGRPVWTLLPYGISDWRWLEGREDTPWYPTMRLFRQPQLGDWRAVMEQVRTELQNSMARSG